MVHIQYNGIFSVCVLSHVQLFATPRLQPIRLQAPRPWDFANKHSAMGRPFSRGSSQPRDQTRIFCASCFGRQVLYHLGHLGIPTAEYYSAIKRNEILPSAAMWMDQENIILVKYARQRKTNTICYYFHVSSKE